MKRHDGARRTKAKGQKVTLTSWCLIPQRTRVDLAASLNQKSRSDYMLEKIMEATDKDLKRHGVSIPA